MTILDEPVSLREHLTDQQVLRGLRDARRKMERASEARRLRSLTSSRKGKATLAARHMSACEEHDRWLRTCVARGIEVPA